MNTKKASFFLLLLTFLVSSISAASGQNVEETLPENFYKYFTGMVAHQPVQAEISSEKGLIFGGYFYEKYQNPISLTLNKEQSKGNYWVFKENADDDLPKKSYDTWKVNWKNGELTGKWLSADGKRTYPILLKENYPSGVMSFKYHYINKKYPANPKLEKDSSYYETTLSYPTARDTTAEAQWLNLQIKKLLGFDTSEDLEKVKTEDVDSEFYAAAEEARKEGYSISWGDDNEISIRYNARQIVQLDAMFYSYLGGAHGMTQEGNYAYDLRNRRIMQLNDITSIDSVSLQKILEKNFREQYGSIFNLKPTDSLKEVLFENHIPPNQNFYFEQKGLEFIYNQYEIAPYAAGIIYIDIPYEDLIGTLNPAFEKRMRLSFGKEKRQDSTRTVQRKAGESIEDFAERIKPDSTDLITDQVFETTNFDGKTSILAFYRKTIHETYQMETYVDHSQYDVLSGCLYVPTGKNVYQPIHFGHIEGDGGDPIIISVFFVNADEDPQKELAVLCKIPQQHYDYDGAMYETYIYDYDPGEKQFTYMDISHKFDGCDCGFRDGHTEEAKYQTAAAVKAKLKTIGFGQ